MLFAGCGKPSASEFDQPGQSSQPAAGGQETQAPAAGSGNVAESYTAYLEAKNAVLTKLTDGISNNPDTVMAALSFMGIAKVDLAALPASLFGLGQEAVSAGLSMVGATDVKYTENGNSYTVSYSDEENNAYVFSGTYDPAADALTCTATKNGTESISMEYRKTAFGYAGQYYMLNDDGTAEIYMIAVDGENGTIGISSATEKPAALTGSEVSPNAVTGTDAAAAGNADNLEEGTVIDTHLEQLIGSRMVRRQGVTAPLGFRAAGITAGQLRQLACDAEILPAVLDGEGVPLDVGRSKRLVPPDLRVALVLRDRGCVFPGCDRPSTHGDAHHIVPWVAGGETSLANCVLVCRHHHNLVEPHPNAPPGSRWEIRLGPDGLPEVLPPTRVDPARAPRRHVRFGTVA